MYASSIPTCRAVYLHVITYNTVAIEFYTRKNFVYVKRLSNFYFLKPERSPYPGRTLYDAFLYAYYINGGRPPLTPLTVVTFTSLAVQRMVSPWICDIPGWQTCVSFSQNGVRVAVVSCVPFNLLLHAHRHYVCLIARDGGMAEK